jgi:hypothetical protein
VNCSSLPCILRVNKGELQNSDEYRESSVLPLWIEQVICSFHCYVYWSVRHFQRLANRWLTVTCCSLPYSWRDSVTVNRNTYFRLAMMKSISVHRLLWELRGESGLCSHETDALRAIHKAGGERDGYAILRREFLSCLLTFGARRSVVVEKLWHRPEGRGFDSPWGHWIFSIYLILPLTSPTSGGRSIGIVRLRTKATE